MFISMADNTWAKYTAEVEKINQNVKSMNKNDVCCNLYNYMFYTTCGDTI